MSSNEAVRSIDVISISPEYFFDPDAEKNQDTETNLADETPEASVDNEEPEEQEPEETTEQ